MRTLLSITLVLLLSSPARAEGEAPTLAARASGRGWVTGLGVGLLGFGFAGLGVGLGAMVNAADANQLLTAYYPTPEAAPTAAEAPVVTQLTKRRDDASTLGIASLIAGGVLVVGGAVCVLLDGAGGPHVEAAFVPAPGGGALVLSGRF